MAVTAATFLLLNPVPVIDHIEISLYLFIWRDTETAVEVICDHVRIVA